MRMVLACLAALPLVVVAPAQARDESTAVTEISNGAFDRAEQKLLRELRIHPGRPELLLNLAAVYAKTGRVAEARTLYRKVLSKDDVLMDLSPERTAGSHALAQLGLSRTNTVQFTAR
jgi:predicted Zn-dependent protease